MQDVIVGALSRCDPGAQRGHRRGRSVLKEVNHDATLAELGRPLAWLWRGSIAAKPSQHGAEYIYILDSKPCPQPRVERNHHTQKAMEQRSTGFGELDPWFMRVLRIRRTDDEPRNLHAMHVI